MFKGDFHGKKSIFAGIVCTGIYCMHDWSIPLVYTIIRWINNGS